MMAMRKQSVEVPYGWIVIFASLALHSIALGAPNILFVTLKPIAADFDAPRSVPSFAYSLMMIGAGIGGVAMGWWMDKRGILQPILFGSVMIGIGALVASQAEGRFSLYFANGILIGLFGKAAMIAPLVANATRWFDRRRGLAVAIIASGQGVSGAIWPPIIDSINGAVGWRDTYFYYGLLVFAAMLPLTLLLRPKPPGPLSPVAGAPLSGNGLVLGLAPNAVQALLWVASICCCVAMAVPLVHLVSHATDLGMASTRAAELLTVLFGAAIISRLGFGMLADRIGGVQTLLIGSACQACMLTVFIFVNTTPGLYIAAFLFGLGFSGIMPCYPLILRLLFPLNQIGWRIASQYLFSALGMALGGWLGGMIFDITGSYVDAFIAALGFNLVNLGIASWLLLRQTRMGLNPLPV